MSVDISDSPDWRRALSVRMEHGVVNAFPSDRWLLYRSIVVNWLIEVSEDLQLRYTSLVRGVAIFDAYCEHSIAQHGQTVPVDQLQCTATAAIYVAAALSECNTISLASVAHYDLTADESRVAALVADMVRALSHRLYVSSTLIDFVDLLLTRNISSACCVGNVEQCQRLAKQKPFEARLLCWIELALHVYDGRFGAVVCAIGVLSMARYDSGQRLSFERMRTTHAAHADSVQTFVDTIVAALHNGDFQLSNIEQRYGALVAEWRWRSAPTFARERLARDGTQEAALDRQRAEVDDSGRCIGKKRKRLLSEVTGHRDGSNSAGGMSSGDGAGGSDGGRPRFAQAQKDIGTYLRSFQREPLTFVDTRQLEMREMLSKGTYGTVFVGKWRSQEVVAVKRLETRLCDATALREICLLAFIQHRHIVPTQAASIDSGSDALCLVMPLMQGGTLRQCLHSRRVRFERWHGWMAQLADALAYLHSWNIAHRDLKSSNVMLSSDLNDAYLIDLSISHYRCYDDRRYGERWQRRPSKDSMEKYAPATTSFGTLWYRAPELLNNCFDCDLLATDVWSFGILCLEIVFGYEVARARDEPGQLMEYLRLFGEPLNGDMLFAEQTLMRSVLHGRRAQHCRNDAASSKQFWQSLQRLLPIERAESSLAFFRSMLRWQPQERSTMATLQRDPFLSNTVQS